MKKILILIVLFFLIISKIKIYAQEKEVFYQGEILKIEKLNNKLKFEVLLKDSNFENSKIKLDIDSSLVLKNNNLKTGDQVLVGYSRYDGKDFFYLKDFIRIDKIIILFLIFIFLTLIISKKTGLKALLAMVFSFVMIFYSIIPNILKGYDPVISVIIAGIFIIPINFFISHGFNKKTLMAILGSVISLIITGFLAYFFVEITKLTGYSSEESGFLEFYLKGSINMKGLLLAGVIIGFLGAVDDITISQSAIVFQLNEVNKKLTSIQLFKKSMEIGQDHIASMINTLILVYTGAAFPLLLLFVYQPRPLFELVNYEIIAEEIIRTLVGSIGLILAVPITTFLAVKSLKKN